MKKVFTLLTGVLCTATLSFAQTLHIYQGQTIINVPAANAADMTFENEGANLVVMGQSYAIGSLSQLLIDETPVTADAVDVTYTTDGAMVSIPADLAPYLTITTNGGHVSIVASADLKEEVTYTLSGTSDNGSFTMDGKYKATVVLENLVLTNPTGAAIDIENGKRINIEVPDGTVTTLVDGASGAQKACFFVNGHAEFKGGGTLNITGNAKHAYASDEYTLIKPSFGTLKILGSANDGLHVQQYFEMRGGLVDIQNVAGDCIDVSATKDATDENNGQAIISGGKLNMAISADDVKGLKTDSAVTISGGTIYANVSGLGGKGISVGTDLTVSQADDAVPTTITMDVSGTTYMPGDAENESKCRGIKVKGNFALTGGTISMNVTGAKAKGISVDGEFTQTGGTTNVQPS